MHKCIVSTEYIMPCDCKAVDMHSLEAVCVVCSEQQQMGRSAQSITVDCLDSSM